MIRGLTIAQPLPPGYTESSPHVTPAALVGGAAVGLLLVVLVVLFRRRRLEPTHDAPTCGQCGYPVSHLTTFACPECGSDLREVGINRPRRPAKRAANGSPEPQVARPSLALRLSAWTLVWAGLGAGFFYGAVLPLLWPALAVQAVDAAVTSDAGVYRTFRLAGQRRTYTFGADRRLRPVVVDALRAEVTLPFAPAPFAMEVDPNGPGYRYERRDGGGVRSEVPADEAALATWLADVGVNAPADAMGKEVRAAAALIGAAVGSPAGPVGGLERSFNQPTPGVDTGPFFQTVYDNEAVADPFALRVWLPVAAGAAWLLGAWRVRARHARRLEAIRTNALPDATSASSPSAMPSPFGSALSSPFNPQTTTRPVNARTITVMFTDMKDYTARTAQESRTGVLDLVRRHRSLVQPVVRDHGGRIVKTIGDALLVAFDSATGAVLAGVEVQHAIERHNRAAGNDRERIELRIAISTGEVTEEAGDVYGDPVNLASRVQSLASPGEVLLTELTWATVNKREVRCAEMGLFDVKGLTDKVRVFKALQAEPTALAPEADPDPVW